MIICVFLGQGKWQVIMETSRGEVNGERATVEARSPVSSPPDLGFGDDVVHDHVDHGTSSKGQSVGQEGLGQHHREGAEDPGQWLHHATQLPVPEEQQRQTAAGRAQQTLRTPTLWSSP